MDYANLVSAVQENNTQEANKIIEALRPRLIAFLRIHMNANRSDAEDCAQDSLLTSLEVIKEDRVNNPDQVVSYILSICRNNYLKMQKKKRPEATDEIPDESPTGPYTVAITAG
ncbi:hypothetical protein [Fodinibius sp.]|uniref:RNA polymerase sigma factor n=1 Tax=Fodinibius sp. TaxID=1872440 RepID=UPI002ACE4E46|nr:hypothetical protein [Fodinibius sp.]MDZ7659083.1 hypothetical protein [Fodinibius sp.]